MRDSFILFTSYRDKLEVLNNEQMGELFKAILNYECDDSRKMPKIDDPVVNAVFYFIKSDLDNNYQKYQETCNKRQKNLDKANEKKNSANAMQSEDDNCKRSANASVNGANADLLHSDNDNDNEHDNDNELLKKKNKKEKDFSFESVCDGELLNSLKEFEKMRKSIKKPLTPKARSMLWNKLNKMSSDLNTQIAIVNQSIFHNWQDVYELKDNSKEVPNYDDAQTDNGLAISDEEYLKLLERKRGI